MRRIPVLLLAIVVCLPFSVGCGKKAPPSFESLQAAYQAGTQQAATEGSTTPVTEPVYEFQRNGIYYFVNLLRQGESEQLKYSEDIYVLEVVEKSNRFTFYKISPFFAIESQCQNSEDIDTPTWTVEITPVQDKKFNLVVGKNPDLTKPLVLCNGKQFRTSKENPIFCFIVPADKKPPVTFSEWNPKKLSMNYHAHQNFLSALPAIILLGEFFLGELF